MKARLSRTQMATLLTAAAVIIPCSAWYVAGSRSAKEQAANLRQAPAERALREADRLAHQVALRLESLRESESRRPFSDYFRTNDPRWKNCSIEPQLVSPLMAGPTDPLIWTHFQLDEVGRLSLPTTEDGDAEATLTAVMDELECAEAGPLVARHPTSDPARARVVPSGRGIITVGPFSWRSVQVKNQPALVALREVKTPSEVLSQGFVVLAETLDTLVLDSLHPAQVRPGETPTPGLTAAAMPLRGAAWVVSIDASASVAAASAEAAGVVARFRRNFGFGALAVLLAAGCVVALVHRTERLAGQRVRFAASAAHELRTPLAGMKLYGEMLAEQLGNPERRESYARRIVDEADRLGRVVSNVLGFSGLQREGLSVHPRAGDLSRATREVIERLRPLFESHGVKLVAAIDQDLPPARFDDDALHQMLQNLLDNAEKYGREAPDRTIRISLARDAEGAVLSVADRGPGVPATVRRRLFHPFARHPSPGAPAGLGVGLALVRELARAQGARVAHRDAQGGGSVFSVYFPTAA